MTQATITQCVLLVGGKGTRLGSLTTATPKPLLPCGDRPFLAWLLREFLRFGVTDFLLLTGHLSGAVEQAVADLQAGLPKPARISISREPVPAGTAGALHHARGLLHERFLLSNGDLLFDANLAALLAAGRADGPDVLGRLMLRRQRDVSRYGTVALEGDRVTGFRSSGGSGVINAGIYLLNRDLVDRVGPEASLEADILPVLAAEGRLRGTICDGYFRDIGIPTDYGAAQAEIPALLRRRALFLDRDGVLNIDHGYVGSRERFEWTPGARDAIRMATSLGWHVFIVTNQSGVARGYYTEGDVRALLDWIADQARAAGGTVDDARFCPYHPEAAVEQYRMLHHWRKPEPGMILDLIEAWELDPARCIMVGDQQSDMDAARAAGVAGRLFGGGPLTEFLRPLLQDRA